MRHDDQSKKPKGQPDRAARALFMQGPVSLFLQKAKSVCVLPVRLVGKAKQMQRCAEDDHDTGIDQGHASPIKPRK